MKNSVRVFVFSNKNWRRWEKVIFSFISDLQQQQQKNSNRDTRQETYRGRAGNFIFFLFSYFSVKYLLFRRNKTKAQHTKKDKKKKTNMINTMATSDCHAKHIQNGVVAPFIFDSFMSDKSDDVEKW